MPDRALFELPEGLELTLDGDSLAIRFAGDVRLNTTLGRRLVSVDADGDVELDLPLVTGAVRAGGTLTVRGDVDAESLHGEVVELGRQRVRCRAVSATKRIVIGAATLKVDAIVAPEIALDPNASGRVTVIESHNERGPSKIKGGFSIADYQDMIGSADEFLAARGLARLPSADASAESTPFPALDEDIDDPESLSIDDIEPIEDLDDLPLDDSDDPALDAKLDDAVGRIVSCYDGSVLPPTVEELRMLVSGRDYDTLGGRITDIWNGLLSYHQKRGLRPHHQVTHAFNVIHSLVNR